MTTGRKKDSILPYALRVEIWNLIDQSITTGEIIERLYSQAPPGVPEELFKECIGRIKGKHTLGQRPSER